MAVSIFVSPSGAFTSGVCCEVVLLFRDVFHRNVLGRSRGIGTPCRTGQDCDASSSV